jgi:hypothetical protein
MEPNGYKTTVWILWTDMNSDWPDVCEREHVYWHDDTPKAIRDAIKRVLEYWPNAAVHCAIANPTQEVKAAAEEMAHAWTKAHTHS